MRSVCSSANAIGEARIVPSVGASVNIALPTAPGAVVRRDRRHHSRARSLRKHADLFQRVPSWHGSCREPADCSAGARVDFGVRALGARTELHGIAPHRRVKGAVAWIVPAAITLVGRSCPAVCSRSLKSLPDLNAFDRMFRRSLLPAACAAAAFFACRPSGDRCGAGAKRADDAAGCHLVRTRPQHRHRTAGRRGHEARAQSRDPTELDVPELERNAAEPKPRRAATTRARIRSSCDTKQLVQSNTAEIGTNATVNSAATDSSRWRDAHWSHRQILADECGKPGGDVGHQRLLLRDPKTRHRPSGPVVARIPERARRRRQGQLHAGTAAAWTSCAPDLVYQTSSNLAGAQADEENARENLAQTIGAPLTTQFVYPSIDLQPPCRNGTSESLQIVASNSRPDVLSARESLVAARRRARRGSANRALGANQRQFGNQFRRPRSCRSRRRARCRCPAKPGSGKSGDEHVHAAARGLRAAHFERLSDDATSRTRKWLCRSHAASPARRVQAYRAAQTATTSWAWRSKSRRSAAVRRIAPVQSKRRAVCAARYAWDTSSWAAACLDRATSAFEMLASSLSRSKWRCP